MSKASEFDVDFYLLQNSDVTEAIENGEFSDALQHFNFFGSEELRAPNELFDPVFYLSENPDVAASVSDGNFENSFQHYQSYGETENRAPNEGFMGFNARSYLDENIDVAFAVENGFFSSALDHFITFGRSEARSGTNIAGNTLQLTAGIDEIQGSLGDDKIFGNPSTLSENDILDGGGGLDTLMISLDTRSFENINFPNAENISNLETLEFDLENFTPIGDQNQFINLQEIEPIQNVKVSGGSTIDNSSIRLQFAENQILHLSNIIDGDIHNISASDGGFEIINAPDSKNFHLTLDQVASQTDNSERAVAIDFSSSQLVELNL